MSAPALWIFLPAALGLFLMLLRNQKLIVLIAGVTCVFLAAAALLLPIDTVLTLGSLTFKLTPAFVLLGRRLILTNAERALLTFLFGGAGFWFMTASSILLARRLIPLGLMITALLVAALAVEPFLYAALIIEVAVLLSVPFISAPERRPGKGVLRFLLFQTLAMPFILFSGWLLTGIEANPGDLALLTRAGALLGLGFALLLAVFPFYTWIPLLTEETHPYVAGFVLWIFPTAIMFFGLGFLDRYAWLRDSTALGAALTAVGAIMVVSAGLLAMFQRHLGRLMGHAVIIETGFSLLGLGIGGRYGFTSFLLLLAPRLVSLALWAYSLAVLQTHAPDLTLDSLKGAARKWPFATSGAALAGLSLAGIPLLAAFPAHQAVWDGVARQSLATAFWVLIGSLGLTIGVIRMLAAAVSAPEGTLWTTRETWPQRVFIFLGWLILIFLGLFPQWASALWVRLPALFEHLGR